ncbi:hypothetical protein C8J56DRAFT_730228, partial [Mycena floridula]
ECLRTNHGAVTIGTGSKVADRLTQVDHKPNRNCQCTECRFDRNSGCANPHACARTASIKLTQILPKWTDRREDRDMQPVELASDDARVLVNMPKTSVSLSQGFTVLTKHDQDNETYHPRRQRVRRHQIDPVVETVIISCAGYGLRAGQSNAIACGGLWLGPGHESNMGIKIPDSIPASLTNGTLTAI